MDKRVVWHEICYKNRGIKSRIRDEVNNKNTIQNYAKSSGY